MPVSMRDAFWNALYEKAKDDRNIVILSADFAAPSLDKFRLNLPSQFINLGISEQNMILVAAGMAIEGKKPFCYAIAPFLTMRCFEQIRLYPAGMRLPVTLVGVGAGVSYVDSGYTHHAIEDMTIIRSLPNFSIYNASDSMMAEQFVSVSIENDNPKYIRLDREIFQNFNQNINFEFGFRILRSIQDITIIATGNMTHTAIKIADIYRAKEKSIGVIDLFKIPLNKKLLVGQLKSCRHILTLEEHSLNGGMGSYILEILNDEQIQIPVKRIGMNMMNGYSPCHNYGGREAIRKDFGMGFDCILKSIDNL